MDVLLDRLEELVGSSDGSPLNPRGAARLERLTEAHMLWRTLEVLVESFNPHELSAGDPAFSKLLSCVRNAVDNADYWSFPLDHVPPPQVSGEVHASVHVFAVRVVANLASRGECEREVMVRAGIAAAIVRSLQPSTLQCQDALAVASALNAMTRIARDVKLRRELVDAVATSLEMMQLHPHDAAVQLSCCSFLQQMMHEPSGKDRIPRATGIFAVLDALRRFPNELLLATTGLDLLSAMCTHSGWGSPSSQGLENQVQEITATVVAIVDAHRRSVQVAETGVKLLNSLVLVHPSTKRALVESGVWELAEVALDVSSDEAARGLAGILTVLVADQRCMDALNEGRQLTQRDQTRRQAVREKLRASSPNRVKSRDSRVEGLVKTLLSATNEANSDCVLNTISPETQLLPPPDDEDWSTHNVSESIVHVDSDDDECPIADGPRHHTSLTSATSSRENVSLSDNLPGCGSVSPLPSPPPSDGLGFYEQFLSEAEAIVRAPAMTDTDGLASTPENATSNRADTPKSSPETSVPSPISASSLSSILQIDDKLFSTKELQRRIISDASTSTQWQDRCESVSKDYESLLASHNALKDNFRILERRANEQSNLLSIQSSRLQHQSQMHQQVLDRMRTLASELTSMKKQYQVEHELRLAEATQSERMSLTLHEATQEIKVLNSQRNSASRELLEKEKLRMDYQSRATEIKQVKQRLEIERDEAVIALQVIKQEKVELLHQLEECRREGRESLGMREEDVDARKPRVFSEVLRPGSASMLGSRRGTIGASPRSNANNSALKIPRAEDRQAMNGLPSPPQYGSNTLENLANDDWADPSDTKRIDRDEIERCLQSVYELLDASAEGDGVHISTVRRFFLESGLAQPPSVVAADVDVILAKVLAQSNENLKKTLVRKDYAFGQAPQPPARVDVRKYRFFDQAAFNEAVTIVGMKRFPRLDLLHVLQNVVSLYLLPYRRQFRTRNVCSNTSAPASNNAPGNTLNRSMSMCLSPTNGGVQSSGCASVVRAILSGLALHIGRGNDQQQLAFDGDTSEIRYHSSSNNSNTGSGGAVAKRKREDVVYSMLEMHGVLSREQKPLVAIFEFYGSLHHAPAAKDELFGLGFELVLNFAMDFEVIPSFMDRVSLKHLHSEVAGYVKTYFALQKKVPFAADTETLKKSAFLLVLARVAIELFASKVEFETPERQISALLQWIDNSVGREKILRKASLPIVIKFSRRLYAPNS